MSETDWGTWRRLVVVPFPFTFRRSEQDCHGENDKVANERVKALASNDSDAITAFLAWRIVGAKKWYDADKAEPNLPPSIQEATEEWRYRSDSILGWTSENLVYDPKSFCLTEDLLDDFNAWSIRNGSTWGQKTFLERLTNHDVFKKNYLEYKRGRHTKLTQALWQNPKDPYTDARIAGDTCTHIKGVRFRTAADNAVIPDDASELTQEQFTDELVDENFETFDDEVNF